MASSSIISSGCGEATTRRQPRPDHAVLLAQADEPLPAVLEREAQQVDRAGGHTGAAHRRDELVGSVVHEPELPTGDDVEGGQFYSWFDLSPGN